MIKYFISSTFRDMQPERDVINRNVLYRLRSVLEMAGEDLMFTDLRWGINTEDLDDQEGMEKILSVCMQEIDVSYPHFLILLGDRYGSVPDEAVLGRFLENAGGRSFAGEKTAGRSVTELEIMHALGHQKHAGTPDVTVCIREIASPELLPLQMRDTLLAGSPEEKEKTEELKAKLTRLFPDRILRYQVAWDPHEQALTGMEEFADRLYQVLLDRIKGKLRAVPVSAQEKRRLASEGILRRCAGEYIPQEETDAEDGSFLENGKLLLIFGDTGSGKTMQLCALEELAREKGFLTVPLLQSVRGEQKIPEAFLKDLICGLDPEHYNAEEQKDQQITVLRKRFSGMTEEIAKNRRILFLLDDVDAYDPETRRALLRELPAENRQVRMAFAARTADSLPEFLRDSYPIIYRNIGTGDPEFAGKMVRKMLSLRGKEFSGELIAELERASAFRTPLYTKLLVEYISQLRGEDFGKIERRGGETNGSRRIYAYMANLLDTLPGTETQLAELLLESAGKQTASNPARLIRNLLCMIPDGLRMEDLLDLYIRVSPGGSISELDLILFFENCGEIFQRENEWIQLRHALFEPDSAYCSAVLPAVLDYLNSLEDGDALKEREYLPAALYQKEYDGAAQFLRGGVHRIASLKKHLFTRERYVDDVELLRLLEEPEKWDMPAASEFVSAFLYSYDELFQQMSPENVQRVMERMYRLCMDRILPEARNVLRKEKSAAAVEHFRNCYVCCEQRGIRTEYYDVRLEMYSMFYHLCFELLKMLEPGDPHYEMILEDYCTAVEKMAEQSSIRMEQKMSLLDGAYRILESYEFTEREERITSHKYLIRFHRISLLVEKARINRQIGWPDDILEGHLEEVEDAARKLIEYRRSREDSVDENGGWICQAFTVLADAYRSARPPRTQEEIRCTKELIDFAGQWYQHSGAVRALDMIRNGWLRLVMDDPSLTQQERCSCMIKSCEALRRMYGQVPEETLAPIRNMSFRIALKEYDAFIAKLQSESEDAAGTGYAPAVRTTEACCEIFELICRDPVIAAEFPGNLPAEISGSCIEYYLRILKILMKQIDILNEEMVFLAKQNLFESALKICDVLDHAFKAMDLRTEEKEILRLHGSIYYNIYAVYHNYLLWDDLPADERFRKEMREKRADALEKAGFFLLRAMLSDPCSTDEYEQTLQKYPMLGYNISESLCNSWIRTAAYFLAQDNRKTERFWALLQEHRFFGAEYEYLFTLAPKKPEGEPYLNVIGAYMAEHINEKRVLDFLARNDLFEAAALEYAYRKNLTEIAHRILYNQYLSFLELPLTLIVRRYDRKEYEKIFPGLRPSCLKRLGRHIRLIQSTSNIEMKEFRISMEYLLRDIRGREAAAMLEVRQRMLEEEYDALYLAAGTPETGTTASGKVPLIAFVEKDGCRQFAACMFTGPDAGFDDLAAQMAERGFRRAGKVFASLRGPETAAQRFPDSKSMKTQRAIQRVTRKLGAELQGNVVIWKMGEEELLDYLTAWCISLEKSWNPSGKARALLTENAFEMADNVMLRRKQK